MYYKTLVAKLFSCGWKLVSAELSPFGEFRIKYTHPGNAADSLEIIADRARDGTPGKIRHAWRNDEMIILGGKHNARL